jgi:hypothetical protein
VNPATLSLREAVNSANGQSGADTIWLPAWRAQLTLSGTGDTALINDLDVTSDVTIVGTGAGASVIDASGISPGTRGFDDRLFHVSGATAALRLSRLTLTGASTSGTGGAILSNSGSYLELNQVAVVGNSLLNTTTPQTGGAIRSGPSSTLVVRNSVISGNSNNGYGTGIYANGNSLTIANTIFANNPGTRKNIGRPVATTLINEGNNVSDEPYNFSAALGDVILTDTPQYVVNSVVDTNRVTFNPATLSLREAVMQANLAGGSVIDTILLPAWNFGLTIARRNIAQHPTDILATYGDLDIEHSLRIRGIDGGVNNRTTVGWRGGVVDKVFELLGDYNNDGEADYGSATSADYTIWADTLGSTTDLRADGNDNGIVDQADWQVWYDHFGRTLDIDNVLVA